MTFDEVLDQIRALLRQRGRVTYRSLKRRFNLDDEYVEDLKGELIEQLDPTVGLPKALIRKTCKGQRCCWKSYRDRAKDDKRTQTNCIR